MRKTKGKIVLLFYLIATICNTVLFRPSQKNYSYELTPFWSYVAVEKGPIGWLFYQIVLNVILFIPIGFLFAYIFRPIGLLKSFIPGLLFSIIIELLQLVFKRGLCEVDDVIHNTVGYVIGYCCCVIFINYRKHRINRQNL